jgi:hypothetical protein
VHDLFDILGVPSTAPPSEVRRVCARRVRRIHPDFHAPGVAAFPEPDADEGLPAHDLAVDFIEMGAFVDRIQAAFFGRAS